MNITRTTSIVLTAGLTLAAGDALAAKACALKGNYSDSLGSTIVFKNNKKGTAFNSAICANKYALTVTKNTQTALDVTGTASGCGNLTGTFTPNYPSCTSATGTVTITGLGSLPDTITKNGDAIAAPREPSALEAGLK